MTDQTEKPESARRGFLKAAGLTGFAAAVAGVAVTKGEASEPEGAPKTASYRETDHIRDYYKSAKF